MPQIPDAAMLQGMQAMADQGGGMPPPMDPMGGMGGAPPVDDVGGMGEIVAMLVSENVQLRALLGLGPDDPIPAAPGGAGAPPPAQAAVPPVQGF